MVLCRWHIYRVSMKLFDEPFNPDTNLLPFDGEVYYYGKIFSQTESFELFRLLMTVIHWQNDESFLYGKHYVTKRKVAWFAHQNTSYTYSGKTHHAEIWNPFLLEIKEKVEHHTKQSYNACLLNLYHSGEEGMGMHQDSEKELQIGGSIASLSFGAERKFVFKHLDKKEKVELLLEDGSLLEMKGMTQRFWQHGLPVSRKIIQPRINLTFRQMK